MTAEDLRQRLLDVEVIARAILAAALTDRRAAVVVDADRIEAGRHLRDERALESHDRGIEAAHVFGAADVQPAMAGPAGAQAREQARAERRAEVRAQHVVPAVMVAVGERLLFAAGLGARLAPAVVAVAEEEAMVAGEVVIDPGDAGRVGVEPRVAGREVVVALGVGIRVRRHHELHQVGAPPDRCGLAGMMLPGNGCGTPLMVFSGS